MTRPGVRLFTVSNLADGYRTTATIGGRLAATGLTMSALARGTSHFELATWPT